MSLSVVSNEMIPSVLEFITKKTVVVTTVATENRMTTHAIFFLIYRCSMLDTVFKKKSSFKDDNNNDTQKSGEPKTTTNGRFRAFAVVAAIAETSQANGLGPLASLESFETARILERGSTQ